MTITVGTALNEARKKIGAVDARALLCHVMAREAAYLIAHADAVLGEAERRVYAELTSRRAAGEPVAYLTGEREFFSLSFKVTPAVLIPRPETELLVEAALARIPRDRPCRVLDLGTGSGCVAITIARHRPCARVAAADCSQDALEVAAANAKALAVHNVVFAQGDWFGAVGGERFDLIVSNPPYVAASDPHLRAGDLAFEPRQALLGGVDGLTCIGEIIRKAGGHLVTGGWLIVEHGIDQSGRCRALLEGAGFARIFSRRDLAGIERISGGRFGTA